MVSDFYFDGVTVKTDNWKKIRLGFSGSKIRIRVYLQGKFERFLTRRKTKLDISSHNELSHKTTPVSNSKINLARFDTKFVRDCKHLLSDSRVGSLHNCTMEELNPGGGGGTPVYELYRYVPL